MSYYKVLQNYWTLKVVVVLDLYGGTESSWSLCLIGLGKIKHVVYLCIFPPIFLAAPQLLWNYGIAVFPGCKLQKLGIVCPLLHEYCDSDLMFLHTIL